MTLSNDQIVIRLLVATLVGMILGIERERRHKPAGVRTHIMICLASTILTIISAYGFAEFAGNGINSDPARLTVGVLTGIGFIGAGIIWKAPSGSVQGITTAANIFLLASLGIAIGLGYYFLVAIATAIGFVTLDSVTWINAYRIKYSVNNQHATEDEKNQTDGEKLE